MTRCRVCQNRGLAGGAELGLGYDDWDSFGAITIGHCALRLLLNTPEDPHVSIARARSRPASPPA